MQLRKGYISHGTYPSQHSGTGCLAGRGGRGGMHENWSGWTGPGRAGKGLGVCMGGGWRFQLGIEQ